MDSKQCPKSSVYFSEKHKTNLLPISIILSTHILRQFYTSVFLTTGDINFNFRTKTLLRAINSLSSRLSRRTVKTSTSKTDGKQEVSV